YRVSSAHEEGGERFFAVSTERFEGDGGRVKALHLVDVEFVDGRFAPVAGSERAIPADTVLLAMGFTGPENGPLVEQFGLPLTERGAIARHDDYSTEIEGVFVAGDAGRGQSLIVWAIAEGRAAAASVDRYLMGTTNLPSPIRASARPLMV
ncbi:MAG: FAD-dependent oxidoreductase, partial [Candidatus Nanopelagicales bacterium]